MRVRAAVKTQRKRRGQLRRDVVRGRRRKVEGGVGGRVEGREGRGSRGMSGGREGKGMRERTAEVLTRRGNEVRERETGNDLE